MKAERARAPSARERQAHTNAHGDRERGRRSRVVSLGDRSKTTRTPRDTVRRPIEDDESHAARNVCGGDDRRPSKRQTLEIIFSTSFSDSFCPICLSAARSSRGSTCRKRCPTGYDQW